MSSRVVAYWNPSGAAYAFGECTCGRCYEAPLEWYRGRSIKVLVRMLLRRDSTAWESGGDYREVQIESEHGETCHGYYSVELDD